MPVNLPKPIPKRILALPRDQRGYPVPWFVIWLKDGLPVKRGEGEPDFRILAPNAREIAVRRQACWVCGQGPMGVHQVFAIGPMCAINRTTQEPPCHRECVEWAVKACPFLDRGLPEEKRVAGVMIERNPGVTCLWESGFTRWLPEGAPEDGWLIMLGLPERVDWWSEGRKATRAEIEASIEPARAQGRAALAELARLRKYALQLLPAA